MSELQQKTAYAKKKNCHGSRNDGGLLPRTGKCTCRTNFYGTFLVEIPSAAPSRRFSLVVTDIFKRLLSSHRKCIDKRELKI